MIERTKGVKAYLTSFQRELLEHRGRSALVQGSTERRNKKNNNLISYIILSAEIDINDDHPN